MLIGGWALQAHHHARNTVDVDCMTALGNDVLLGEELERAGFECFEEKTAFRRFRHRLDPLMVLDVMRVNAETFAKMWDSSQPYVLDGVPLRVPSLPHLIALKLHAARNEHRVEKDLADVRALVAANPGKVSREELGELCNKFGTEDIAERLRGLL